MLWFYKLHKWPGTAHLTRHCFSTRAGRLPRTDTSSSNESIKFERYKSARCLSLSHGISSHMWRKIEIRGNILRSRLRLESFTRTQISSCISNTLRCYGVLKLSATNGIIESRFSFSNTFELIWDLLQVRQSPIGRCSNLLIGNPDATSVWPFASWD